MEITMQEFYVSPLGAYHPLHIYLSYWNTCMWEGNISCLHSIHQKLALVPALSEAESKNHQRGQIQPLSLKNRKV